MALHYSGLQVFAWMLLLVSTGCLFASFGTDYWSTHEPRRSMADPLWMHRGLLKQCITTSFHSTCHYRFDSIIEQIAGRNVPSDRYSERLLTYKHSRTQNFEVATTALLIAALSFAGIMVLSGPFCCGLCRPAASLLVFLAGACALASCAVYAYFNLAGDTFTLEQSVYQDVFNYDFPYPAMALEGSDVNVLAWSWWLAACSGAALLFSSTLLACSTQPQVDYVVV